MATLYDPDNRFVLDGQQGSAIARLPVTHPQSCLVLRAEKGNQVKTGRTVRLLGSASPTR